MDCLGFLRARAASFHVSAVCAAFGVVAAGCTTTKQEIVSPEAAAHVVVEKADKPDKNKPRRMPQPATCVMMADLRLDFAGKPDCAPADRERLYDEALRAYQQAVKLDPGYVDGYLGLGRLYQKLEEFDKAVATFETGLQAVPKSSKLWFELGICHARRKAWEPALTGLRNASELDPDNHYYTNMVGFCLARAGRFDESYQHFAKAQGEARAHYNVARMLHHVGRDAEARDHLVLALKAKSDFGPAGRLLAELDDPAAQAVKPAVHEESVDEAARRLGGDGSGQGKTDNDWE